jgi:hypothetical protein
MEVRSTTAVAWHRPALVSFVLGLCSLALLLLALTGIPAVVIGLLALRRINASDGQLRGARLAIAGMVMGSLGTLITLAGLLAIGIVQLQLASKRAECANHLREIGVALNKYADVREKFPKATTGPATLPTSRRLSWFVEVLPLLREGTPANAQLQQLASQIDLQNGWDDSSNAPVANTPVRLFLCPGSSLDPRSRPGRTHYVGMAGIGPNAIDLPRDHPRAGLFGNERGVTRAEVVAGTSTTMMVLETAQQPGPWLAGGFPTVRDLDPQETSYSGTGRPFGGLHRDIVLILWVDGAVRPLSDRTEPEVFRTQVTLQRQGW